MGSEKRKYKYVKVRLTPTAVALLNQLKTKYPNYKKTRIVEEGLRLLSSTLIYIDDDLPNITLRVMDRLSKTSK